MKSGGAAFTMDVVKPAKPNKAAVVFMVSGGWYSDHAMLKSYGPDLDVIVRLAATHVDKVLRGARPGDIPIEQPNKFDLIVNLKAARAHGLTVPPAILGRADRVLE